LKIDTKYVYYVAYPVIKHARSTVKEITSVEAWDLLFYVQCCYG